MSEFEFNEDRNDFEVLEDFVFDGGNNNNNNSKRIVKEANEAPILKKKTKRRLFILKKMIGVQVLVHVHILRRTTFVFI
jgi:hypothetical protein